MDFFLALLSFNLSDLYIFKLLNKMDILLVLFCFNVLCMRGVNEFKDKMSAVSNNRHFIVIHNDATTTKPDDHILWMSGAENIHNPHGYEWIISKIDSHVRFKDKQSRWNTIWNYSSYGCGEKSRPDKFARSAFSLSTLPADTDIPLKEGDTVTFYTDVAELHEGDLIKWWIKSQEIAEVTKQSVTIYDNKIKDRIELANQTGSLTIKNIRITDSGDYECYMKKGNTDPSKCFTVTVYDALPIPDISRVSSSSSERSSSSKCVLLCSVLNVRDVSLSWYKGKNSLLSSISVSDLNNRNISLPLEVEYQDTNTYSCVLNNPITNQTQHLNITDLCQPFPGMLKGLMFS
nr:V-set domain-containing T-cell activation inhibitor 1-like [Misgurnus anguillicaudatus]